MATKRVVVDLFYDIISPYSWVGFELMCRYRNQWHSMSLRFQPILLGGLMRLSGNRPPLVVPNKAKYMLDDIARLNHYYKIPMVVPDDFVEVATKKTSLNAMRFVTAVDMLTNGTATEEISRQLFKRVFTSHQDVTLADSLRAAAKCAKIDEQVIEKSIKSMEHKEIKEALKERTEKAFSYGAFGTPTSVLHLADGPQLIFGSDRMEIIGSLLGEQYIGPLSQYSKL